MRLVLCILLVLSVSMAAETELAIFEQRDLGVEYHDEFDALYITMDCEEELMTIYVKSDGEPVTGAMVRLIYIDYSVPLLAAGPTDVDGKFTYKLIGERDFMTGLFLVVVEKEGYKNKEAHFDIARCIGAEEGEEEEIPPPAEEEPEEELPPPPPSEEEQLPAENKTNVTENVTGEPEEEVTDYICIPPAILLLFSFLSLIKQ